ncbi:hypothetical protein M2209_008961 [Bradyrhizobium elkanii]|nr:hypothetical protein [Bradyrhizobium elkanii]MCP1737813.1 hypothetical protein [Bradyrhizobium elkanii]MCS3575973.1 hypothetical protein [Bradyrhizobium elkanii]MCS3594690.1 hypothetical protein [Bradyrhizobium elkanii]MCS3625884.1 hypothetical protein [Bradyrhizobium elkanii]
MIITRGGVPADFKSFFMSRWAARESLRRWIKTSRTKPFWLVDSAPEPMLFARDRDNDFVQMPFVTASGCTLADPIGERLAEFPSPLAHGFIGHANATRRQHFLDHAQA